MSKLLQVVKKMAAPAVGLAALAGTSAAMATGTDYTAITSAVDWSTVATGIVSIMALGAAVIVAFVGGKFLIRAIRSA